MRITLEEIVTELKANYGLEDFSRTMNPFSFEPVFGLKFKDREPITVKNLLTLRDDLVHYEAVDSMLGVRPTLPKLTKEQKLKEICMVISETREV